MSYFARYEKDEVINFIKIKSKIPFIIKNDQKQHLPSFQLTKISGNTPDFYSKKIYDFLILFPEKVHIYRIYMNEQK